MHIKVRIAAARYFSRASAVLLVITPVNEIDNHLDDVVFQNLSSPDAKLGSLLRLDPVADGYDNVEAVEDYRFVRKSNVHILYIAFFIQLTLCENITLVFGDNTTLALKQLS